MKKEISVIVPVYNAKDTLEKLVNLLDKNLIKIVKNYEIILIDDESKDASWNVKIKLSNKNKKIKGLKFARKLWCRYCNKCWVGNIKCKLSCNYIM